MARTANFEPIIEIGIMHDGRPTVAFNPEAMPDCGSVDELQEMVGELIGTAVAAFVLSRVKVGDTADVSETTANLIARVAVSAAETVGIDRKDGGSWVKKRKGWPGRN